MGNIDGLRFMWLNAPELSMLHDRITKDFEIIHSVAAERYGPHTLVKMSDEGLKVLRDHLAAADANVRDGAPF